MRKAENSGTVAKLIFRSGMYAGKNMSLPEGKAIVLGRNRDVDLPLNDAKLSRRHCQITATESGCVITDFASTNGTFVNGNRVEADKQLELIEFDRIVLGDTEIELYLSDPGERILAVSSDDNMPIVKVNDEGSSVRKAVQSPTLTHMKAIEEDERRDIESEMEITADPDPLLAALYEMGLPLPPEPPLPSGGVDLRIEPTYCSYCGSKIPDADKNTGAARMIHNKMACKACLIIPPPAIGHSAKPGVDDMLAGLDSEPMVVDTSKKPRMSFVEHDVETVRNVRSTPLVAPPQSISAEAEDPKVFGDEFEEIGQ
jgi:predicted component of type VI protein secretion system